MKYQINPIELLFFCLVLLVCVTSAIKLTEKTNQTPIAINPVTTEQNRKIASVNMANTEIENEGFIPVTLPCTSNPKTIQSKASKIRLIGTYCGSFRLALNERGTKADEYFKNSTFKILNASTGYEALVILNHSEQRFSTDFISLNEGENDMDVVFNYNLPGTGKNRQFKTKLKIIKISSFKVSSPEHSPQR